MITPNIPNTTSATVASGTSGYLTQQASWNYCPACGRRFSPGWNYCPGCGAARSSGDLGSATWAYYQPSYQPGVTWAVSGGGVQGCHTGMATNAPSA
jgi:hypothetical protein